MAQIFDVRNLPGVYLLIGLDEEPLYAGKSKKLRTRLEQHFLRQNSSATADGLLDIYEVHKIAVWYAYESLALFKDVDDLDEERIQPLGILEASLQKRYKPRWNRQKNSWLGKHPDLLIEKADVTVDLIDSDAELTVRRQPMQRVETKLLHMLRAVRKARISGASPKVRKALILHAKELARMCHRSFRGKKDRVGDSLPMPSEGEMQEDGHGLEPEL